MVLFIALAAALAVSFGVLAAAGVIAAPAGFGRWQGRYQLNLWHLIAGLAVLAALFASTTAPAGPIVLVALVVIVLFAREWVREWLFLMNLSDDHLPGRFDKPIWAALLVFLPPVGTWLFRAYRLRRWPEVAAKPASVAEVS
jgi:hypothetical protein